VSGSSDYLWKDETLVTFINEAQRRFAVKSFVLRDGTTDEATKLVLVAGQSVYPLHEAVMSVLSAKNAAQQSDLTRVGHSLFSSYRTPTDTWQDPASYNALQPGPTLAFSTDEAINDVNSDSFEAVTMRVYPTPTAEQDGSVLRLRVIRKPLTDLVPSALGAVPEIPRDHHIEMLDWAAYLALRIVDDDAGSAKRADEFRQMFETHVTAAKKLVMAKLFAPTGWAFGRGGFTWSN
jgi:hypothetical protein